MKEKILISACLTGKNVKYNGKNNQINLDAINEKYDLILICPEVMGGLSIPRTPCEILNNKVIDSLGNDKTNEYTKGALKALEIAKENNIKIALLKEKSPSCGSNYIYDGTHSKKLILGEGVTTKLLKENGIMVYSEKEIYKLLK